MSDMFKQGDKFPVSAEFSEFISLATDGEFVPTVGGTTEIDSVVTCDSGQTLFRMKVSAVVDDPNNFHPDSGGTVVETRKFPASVAMVQKMQKLQKKLDKEAGNVAPVKVNPNKKVDVIPATPADDGDYDPFAASQDDF